MSIQPFFSLKAQVPSDAIDVISKYYSDFSTEYDHKGQYKMLSNYYQPNFSYSLFELTYHTYDSKNEPIKNTVKFDFKKVISIQP